RHRAGDLDDAQRLYAQVIAHEPRHAAAYNNRGVALRGKGRFKEAVESFDGAIAMNPEYADAYNNRGVALRALGRHEEAVRSYDRAIALRADYVNAHSNRGASLFDLERYAEAVQAYDRALSLDPQAADVHYNRGDALCRLNAYVDAVSSYDRAIALKPKHADAYGNRGNALKALNRHEEALDSYLTALKLDPRNAGIHLNEAFCRLQLGQFAEGWRKLEWRWQTDDLRGGRRAFSQPLWLGEEPVEGKTVLVHAEQGFGDTLQFCRLVPLLAAAGAKVILEVQPSVTALMSSLPGAAHVLPVGAKVPSFDIHIPLMSMPLALGVTAETVPARPYLQADPGRVQHWSDKLGASTKPRIGLAWSGRPTHGNDRHRSMPLSTMTRLIADHLEFVSLQKDVRVGDRPALNKALALRHFGDALGDFSETAALIENLDLVISVDTSVAHLAGA
ncbi:MAG: tetratricopeptide repeat-containing glycosyltransferase family protein, partial [Rhodospirillaceae bacterium]